MKRGTTRRCVDNRIWDINEPSVVTDYLAMAMAMAMAMAVEKFCTRMAKGDRSPEEAEREMEREREMGMEIANGQWKK